MQSESPAPETHCGWPRSIPWQEVARALPQPPDSALPPPTSPLFSERLPFARLPVSGAQSRRQRRRTRGGRTPGRHRIGLCRTGVGERRLEPCPW